MFTKAVIRILSSLVISFCLFGTAYSMSAKESEKIEFVVKEHIAALATNNYKTAYATLSTELRSELKFEEFKNSIYGNFEFLSNPISIIADKPELISGQVVTVVRVAAGNGVVWLVIFKTSPQQDGSWKIDECLMLETNSISD